MITLDVQWCCSTYLMLLMLCLQHSLMISLLAFNIREKSCIAFHKRFAAACNSNFNYFTDTGSSSSSSSSPTLCYMEGRGNNSAVDGISVLRGRDALLRLYQNANFMTSPALDPTVFKLWLEAVSSRKMDTDFEFTERVKLRELRRLHIDAINEVESQLELSRASFMTCAAFDELDQLDREIAGGQQAIASMTRFLLDSNAVLSATSGSDEEVFKPAAVVGSAASMLMSGGVDLNQSAALEPAIVSIAGPMINSANDLQGVQKMTKKVANVQLLLPAKIVDIEAKILLRTDLRSSNPQYEVFKDSERRCLELYESIGLSDAREAVGSMQLFGGHGRNSRGKSFEAVAADVVRSHLIPDVAHKRGIDKHSVFAVRNVKLGMASSKGSTAEFDCLLCVKDKRPDRLENIKQKGIFCKVIAVVEVKRNADDMGEAFMGYQSSLNWLTGSEHLYDSAQWKTKAYPSGHFKDRPFIQMLPKAEESELNAIITEPSDRSSSSHPVLPDVGYMFTPESFSGLRRTIVVAQDIAEGHDSSPSDVDGTYTYNNNHLFVEDLYFVTKDGRIDNISSKAAAWALNKLASECEFDAELTNADAVESLRNRVQLRFPHRMSTLRLIDLYLQHQLTNQIYIVGKFR